MKIKFTYFIGILSIICAFCGFALAGPWSIPTLLFGLIWVILNIYWQKKYFYGPALIGGSSNFAAILANGGYMPVDSPKFGLDNTHILMGPHTHLKLLCDIFHLSFGIFSIGDVFICVGTLLTITIMLWYKRYRKVTQ